jgi:hypothetical protein
MNTPVRSILNIIMPVLVIGMCAGTHAQTTSTLSAPSVAGTLWVGVDSDGDHYEYAFMEDGTLHYASPSGFHVNATWKQDGDTIYFETNNRYSEYQGRIMGGHIEGKAWNTQNHQWTWSAEKQNKPASAANGGVPTIAGTIWSVTESNGDRREFQFLLNGHLAYTKQDGSVATFAWSQKVDAIDLWLGKNEIEYTGRVTGGRMQGTAKNSTGATWTWSAELK